MWCQPLLTWIRWNHTLHTPEITHIGVIRMWDVKLCVHWRGAILRRIVLPVCALLEFERENVPIS